MFGRFVAFAISLAGCYETPQPACGFVCGVNGACPDGYACGDAQRCISTTRPSTDCENIEIPDLLAPSVTRITPENGATGISVETTIVVEFSENVANVANGFDILDPEGRPLLGTRRPLEGNRVWELDPGQLMQNRSYTIVLTEQIVDFVDLPLEVTMATFSTQRDETPPMITASSPSIHDTGVSVSPTLSVTFSEPIQGISQASVHLESAGVLHPITVLQVGLDALEVRVADELTGYKHYELTLDHQIVDYAGNAFVPTAIGFMTGADTSPPMVLDLFPGPGDTNVELSPFIAADFDQNVVGVSSTTFTLARGAMTIPATVTYGAAPGSGEWRARLTPLAPLTPSTAYTAALGPEIRDPSGNSVSGNASWTFTTGP